MPVRFKAVPNRVIREADERAPLRHHGFPHGALPSTLGKGKAMMHTDIQSRIREVEGAREAAERRYAEAQMNLATTGSAEEVREAREAVQLLNDELQGLAGATRLANEEAAENRKAAEIKRRQDAHDAALVDIAARQKLALKIQQRIVDQAADIEEFDRLAGAIASRLEPFTGVRTVRDELMPPTFNPTLALLGRQMVASGLEIPPVDRVTAVSLVRECDFVGWAKRRHDFVRGLASGIIEEG
jgi:hypothetical protein